MAITQKFSSGIVLTTPQPRRPLIKITGCAVVDSITSENLKAGNEWIKGEVIIIRHYDVGRDNKRYRNYIIQLDLEDHTEALSRQKMVVGFMMCKAHEFADPIQCKSCWRYGHFKHSCKFAPVCRICGKGTHPDIDCDAAHDTCANCIRHNKNSTNKLNASHRVTDDRCPCRISRIEYIKNFHMNQIRRRGGRDPNAALNTSNEEIPLPPLRNIEAVAVKNENSIICNVYWPPQAAREKCEDVDLLLNTLSVYNNTHHIVMAGDFNLPGIKWKFDYDIHPHLIPDIDNTRPIEREALLFFHHANMQQITPQANNRGTFLDLLFTNKPDNCEMTDPEEHQVTAASEHHIPLSFVIISTPPAVEPPTYRETHRIQHDKLRESLAKIPRSVVPSKSGITTQLNSITAAIRKAIVTTRRKIQLFESKHPWLIGSHEYRRLRSSIQQATRRGDFYTARLERKEVSKLYAKLKEEYCKSNLNANGSPMDLFNFMRFAKNKQPLPQNMTFRGLPVDNVHEAFIQHLGNAFDNVTEALYSDNEPFNVQLRRIIDDNYIPNAIVADITSFSIAEVFDAISEIDQKKDPGLMMLPPAAFKTHAEVMAEVITPMLNACATTQWIPEDIMRTILVPIPKTGSKKEIENYRGIALSNILCKLIDKIITKKLTIIMEPKLDTAQYGFRQNRSTIGCVFDAAQHIAEQMKWNGRVDAAFLDISKAFDRLSHTSIAIALSKIGIPFRQLLFIMKFVNQRQYFVRVNGTISEESIIPDSGISQGSHIGPALFILVANQIRQHIHPSTKLYQYADDTLLVQSIANREDEDSLQTSINGVAYLLYSDRCAQLKLLTASQRTVQFNVIVAKRFAEQQTFSENNYKITQAMNEPDATRRVPLPLVNVACRRQFAMTPLGHLLKNVNEVNIDFETWMGPFNDIKKKLEQNVLLYV